jgi:hypothetical protein
MTAAVADAFADAVADAFADADLICSLYDCY